MDDKKYQPAVHPATLSDDELLAQSEVQRTRRGGPGGQHRNKVESAIVVTHSPSGIIGQASERRSQHENRAVALERLRINLAMAVRTELAVDHLPSDRWRSRVVGTKIQISTSHADFPLVMAEVFDFLHAENFEVKNAANRLGLSSSQLIKLTKQHPPAWEMLVREREKRGLPRLK